MADWRFKFQKTQASSDGGQAGGLLRVVMAYGPRAAVTKPINETDCQLRRREPDAVINM